MTEPKDTQQENNEELLQFPTDFPIKVMGVTQADFAQRIGAAVREMVPDFDPDTIQSKPSKTGKYTALNVVVHATSREQLDSLYRMLTSHPLVKIVL